jgi:YTH domain-containing family protein
VPGNARFFVIKSFSEADVAKSIAHGLWTSTHAGNMRLQRAFNDPAYETPCQ